jgi:hypothetical protein
MSYAIEVFVRKLKGLNLLQIAGANSKIILKYMFNTYGKRSWRGLI